jgi:hypothetical protein
MKTEVNYRVHKSPFVEPKLSQLNSVHILTCYIFKLIDNIILLSTHRFSKWCPLFRSYIKLCMSFFLVNIRPAFCHRLVLGLIIAIVF